MISINQFQLFFAAGLIFVASSADAQQQKSDFVVIDKGHQTTSYNVGASRQDDYGKYAVKGRTISKPEVIKIEMAAVASVVHYCKYQPGEYPAKQETFSGKPADQPIKNILVQQSYLTAEEGRAPKKELVIFFPYGDWNSHAVFAACDAPFDTISNGTQSTEIFDCRNGLWGMELGASSKATLVPIRSTMNAFRQYKSVCQNLFGDATFIPK